MEKVKIETTQNVLIEHNIANIGDRVLASLIDFSFLFAYFLIVLFLLGITINLFPNKDIIYIVFFILEIPIFFYSLASNLIFQGQTPGKMIMKTKVVKLDGRSPSLGSYLIRWILRLVDIWLFNGVVALITVIINGKGQRLGDIAAGTSVIKLKKKTFFRHSVYKALPPNYELVFEEAKKLSERDVNTINKAIKAYTQNRNSIVTDILFETSNEVKKKTGIKSNMPPKILLETLIRDYNFLNR